MPDFECRNVVLCDDIRQEKSEKYILVGVYSGGVRVQKMPATLRFALFMTLKFQKTGEYTVDVFVEMGSANHHAQITFNISDADEVVAVPLPQFPAKFDDPGNIVVKVGDNGSDAVEVANFSVAINPDIWVPFPTGTQQTPRQSGSEA